MRCACFVVLLLSACGYLHAGEEISPMRGRSLIRPGRAAVPATSASGLQRLVSDSAPEAALSPQPIQPREFVRIKLPPAVETSGRPRIVVVDPQAGDGAIDFTATFKPAPIDDIGIPGLVAPEALAIDKYALHGNGRRLRAIAPPPDPEEGAGFDIASAEWNSKARAFPGFSDRLPEIAVPELLMPPADIAVAIGPAAPTRENNLFEIPPPWDIATLPRGEVRGLEPPAAAVTLLSVPPLQAEPEPAAVFVPEKTPDASIMASPPWDVTALPRAEVRGLEQPSARRLPPPLPTFQPDGALVAQEPPAPPVPLAETLPAMLLATPQDDAITRHDDVPHSGPPLPPGMYP